MEVKAILNKPYTEKQKLDFIVVQNHKNGYIIQENEMALEALGETEEEQKRKTKEEQVAKLEAETGLTRVMREMVLSENSGASDYVKSKAKEIEDLAKQLRTTEEISELETVDNTQNDEYNSFGDTKQ